MFGRPSLGGGVRVAVLSGARARGIGLGGFGQGLGEYVFVHLVAFQALHEALQYGARGLQAGQVTRPRNHGVRRRQRLRGLFRRPLRGSKFAEVVL